MKKFLLCVAALSCCVAGLVGIASLFDSRYAGVAIAFAVIPCCLAWTVAEWKKD